LRTISYEQQQHAKTGRHAGLAERIHGLDTKYMTVQTFAVTRFSLRTERLHRFPIALMITSKFGTICISAQ